MALHAALAAAATLLALAFALSTLERWQARHKKHELMWTISLVMFALGSLALWAGATFGWGEWTYKAFYLFGAVLNVPFLALGTVYLLGRERTADRITAVVSLLAAFAAGIVVAAPVVGVIVPEVLPQGSAVFGPGPRIAAAVGSGVASLVIIGGALTSAARLWGSRSRVAAAVAAGEPAPALSAGRLALANVLIAVGTLVLGAGGTLNSVADAMNAFAISLVFGIALIFGGFLLTSTPATIPDIEPWYPPAPPRRTADPTTGPGPVGADEPRRPVPADAAERADHPSGTRATGVDLADTSPGSPHLN